MKTSSGRRHLPVEVPVGVLLRAAMLCLFWPGVRASAWGLPPVQTVFVVVMENHSWSDIKGNASAPYLNNTLLPFASYCEWYCNVPGVHPSLPNYLWLEAGTNFGIFDDGEPAVNHQNTTNHLVTLLRNAGVSWKEYQENISATALPLSTTADYAARHNPFLYFDDVTGTNNPYDPYGLAHIRPFTELAADLTNNTVARYNFITPDDCDDMHTPCSPELDPVRQGDNWLAREVPKILCSQAYSNNGALFITWDEAYAADTRLGMILLSPLARGGGYTNSIYYSHSSMLRTIQELFNAGPFLGGAANATDLSDLFRPTNSTPAGFQILNITNLGPNVVQLTVVGVATNAPLVLLSSSDLAGWVSLSTNSAPQETCSICVTNDAGNPGQAFYRFAQTFR